MKDYAFLQPMKLGNKVFKNRILYPAMAKHIATEDGFVTDQYVEYARGIAKGGVAAYITGVQCIDKDWHYVNDRQTWLCGDEYLPGLKKVVEAVHAEDCLIFFQPWHPGQVGQPEGVHHTCADLSIDEIRRIQDLWIAAAKRAKEAGADGIEFHAAHNYLPSQFLSPKFNKRTDEYGADTVENAMRFSTEIIDRLNAEVMDDDFILIAKINGCDFVDGGTDIDRAAEACRIFEEHGVKLVTVNGGGLLAGPEYMSDNGVNPEGWKVPLAEKVKSVVSIPVAASDSLRHPELVDAIIREGKCDFAAIGRGIFAEHEWVKKCMEGREDELRYCISCMYCFTTDPKGVSGCSVNPFGKREYEQPELVKDGNGRKVLVVGAGPSGLEAAVTLAERGFDVTIADDKETIGGMVSYAAMPPHKERLGWMLGYYEKQIARLGIKLELNTRADEAYIDGKKPEIVIIAAGSKEFVPEIEGLDGSSSMSVHDAFEFAKKGGKFPENVVILGAGLTGIELGHMIRVSGSNVKIVELMPKPAKMNNELRLALKAAFADGVEIEYSKKVESVKAGVVKAKDAENGEVSEYKADMVIRSMGIRSENALAEILKASEKPYSVYLTGDCEKTGKISTAVQSGADLAYSIK